jgi:methionine synthase II (cobalamin-independent)
VATEINVDCYWKLHNKSEQYSDFKKLALLERLKLEDYYTIIQYELDRRYIDQYLALVKKFIDEEFDYTVFTQQFFTSLRSERKILNQSSIM